MKTAMLCLALSLCLMGRTKADLTILQKVDGTGPLGGDVTLRIKGDKARFDATPQMSTIVDGKTGEVITLLKEQKTAVRISADKMRAAADMIQKFSDKKSSPAAAKPQPTGRRETINGYETEEYSVATPMFKATYWLAPKFPDGAAILKELQAVKSEIWNSAHSNVPDYRDFPALPIKTVIEMADTKLTTVLISVKKDSLSEADFSIPKDYREVKAPEIGSMLQPAKAETSGQPAPRP